MCHFDVVKVGAVGGVGRQNELKRTLEAGRTATVSCSFVGSRLNPLLVMNIKCGGKQKQEKILEK